MEIINTSLDDARAFTRKLMDEKGVDLYQELPDFDKQFEMAKHQASLGYTKRKDMPVIDDKDIKTLLNHLKNGEIDINAPFAPDTDQANLFPEFLKGKKAKNWLEDGEPKHDGGAKSDDVVKATMTTDTIKMLKPIQKQIYFDKSMRSSVQEGIKGSRKFISTHAFVVSSDDHIIDGHHRWLSGMLIDPNMKIKVLKIDLPINQLLDLAKAFGDAVGNRRNA
jgi:hypothetical protein